MFRLLYADIADLCEGGFERLCKKLSAERLKKVESQNQRSDKYLSAAAGYLLQTALTGLGIINPEIFCNEHGKPYITDSDVYFNISHSGAIAVCALSSEEVGVDVQQVRPVNECLIKRICTKDEYAFVTQNVEEVNQRFCRLWTVKESVMKCLGLGLSLAPQRIEVKLSAPCGISIDGVKSPLHFKEYPLNGYNIAVCSSDENFTPDIDKITV